jgi:4-hydroxybenzoate polyprenyltransferase
MFTMQNSHHHKTFTKGFAQDYIITMRPYLLFVSGMTGICGMSFIVDLSILKSFWIFLASFLSYGFGQALTDVFQTDTDSISSPYRPLTQGIISKSQVLTISILGLIFCIAVFSIYNPLNLVLGVVSGLGLATYTYFKKRFWAGPFYNAWIVGVLFLMAYLCGSEFGSIFSSKKLLFGLSAVFWGYANFVLVGYFKDVEADRATGYNTILVTFGRRVASVISNIFGLLTVLSVGLIFIFSHPIPVQRLNSLYAIIVFCVGIIVMVFCQTFVHFINKDDESSLVINLSVHAYIILLSSITLFNKPAWFSSIIIFYLLFNLTIYLRPSKNQI